MSQDLSAESGPPDTLRHQVQAIWQYRWVVVTGVVLGLLFSLATGYLGGPQYTATSEVLVRTTSATPFDTGDATRQISMQTEVQVAESEKVAAFVSQQVGTGQSPDDLTKNLRVTNPVNTTVLRIQYQAGSARQAQRYADEFSKAYLADREARTLSTVNRLVKVLEDETTQLTDRRAELDKQIAAASNSTARASLEAQRTLVLNEVLEIRNKLVGARTVDTTPGDIVRSATAPTIADGPPLSTLLVLGLLVGLAAGVALAWVLSLLRPAGAGTSHLAETLGSPVLAQLPRQRLRAGDPTDDQSKHAPPQVSEQAKALAVGLTYGDVAGGARAMLVVGARAQEPATQVVVEMAFALAQMGRSVAVVEADLRHPTLMRLLPVTNRRAEPSRPGAGRGAGPLPRWPDRRGYEVKATGRLSLYPGLVDGSPLQTLAGTEVEALLKDLRGQVHFVLVTAPPVLEAVDGLELVHLLDGVLLACGRRTATADLRLTCDAIRHAGGTIVGAVAVSR